MAHLEHQSGGKRWELGVTTDIGRDPGCAVSLSDRLASRSHAEIRRGPDGRYRIVDLTSTHGTFVAGRRVTEYLLQHGDEVQIGMTLLRFLDPDAGGGEPAPRSEAGAAAVLGRRSAEEIRAAFPAAEEQKDAKRFKRDYERLRAAWSVAQALTLDGGLDALLARIADEAIRLLSADRVAVLLVDARTGQAVPRVARHRDGSSAEVVVPRSILQQVMSQGAGVLSADAGHDERFKGAKSVLATGMRSAMCVPLLHGGEVLGALHCDTRLATNAFREEDLDLFTSIGAQAAVAVRNALLLQRLQEEATARVQFQRFFSPAIVDQVVTGRLKVGQRGEVRPVAVLFLDVRGFTRWAEAHSPEDVVAALNGIFERTVEVLFRHGGTLDKYMGDGFMALFGAPQDLAEPATAAVACALEIRDELERWGEERRGCGEDALPSGLGVHFGPALCGMLGSSRTRSYTAIGDTVNTAARICAVAPGGTVLVSGATLEALRGRAEAVRLPPVEVKGKSEPLEVHEVRSLSVAATAK
jgi:adenylate cyclase